MTLQYARREHAFDRMQARPWLIALFAGVLAVLVGACSAPVRRDLPVPVELSIAASEGLNPTEYGRPSPVLLRIYDLAEKGHFMSADYFALLDGSDEAKNPAVIAMQELMLMPGEVRIQRRRADLDVRFIGVAVGYRDIEQSAWRAVVPVPAPHKAGRLWAGESSPERKYRLRVGERAVVVEEVTQ